MRVGEKSYDEVVMGARSVLSSGLAGRRVCTEKRERGPANRDRQCWTDTSHGRGASVYLGDYLSLSFSLFFFATPFSIIPRRAIVFP